MPVNVKNEVTALVQITTQFLSNIAHLKFGVLSFVLNYISNFPMFCIITFD